MDENDVKVRVRQARLEDALEELTLSAYERALSARGGPALLHQLWGDETGLDEIRHALSHCVGEGRVWVALRDEQIVGAALIRHNCVQVIWVVPNHRRQGIARMLLRAVLDSEETVSDAWALPGDRATKSLYESVGWKARLLTMRGE